MKIAYVVFYSADLPRAVEFYKRVFQLRVVEDTPNFVGLELEGGLLGIKARSEPREIPGSQTLIVGCRNLEEQYARCSREAVNICKELTTEAWGRNFAILDPDGNKVELMDDPTAAQ
jgi:catechol 2,3-dioxygenase-like lactoylglutathione lyase family enzyme